MTRRLRTARLPMLWSWVAMGLLLSGPAHAQQSVPRPELERAEPAAMMGERAFRRFEAVGKLYAEERYGEALTAVEAYLRGELSAYERAMGEQMAGYILVSLDRTAEAIPRFERALELDVLANNAHFGTMRALAQLYGASEQWQRAIEMLTRYLRYQAQPAAEDMVLMAQGYARLGRHREGLPWVQRAIAQAGPRAAESWYQLELYFLFELRDYRAAVAVLKALVARWPEQLRYWEMLAGAYQELNQDRDALAALMAAWNAGLMGAEPRILNLARLSLYLDLPYQAGLVLQAALDDGRVEAGEANLRLLLNAWVAAREYDRAVAVIDRLAPLIGDGELYMQKARILMEQNRWRDTVDAARQAVELGKLASPGQAWLLIGIAAMELGELRESRQALQRAQGYDETTRAQAREWQRFVEERIQVADARAGRG